MNNIICKAFSLRRWGWGWGGIGDREWTIMVLLHAVQGSMLGIFFMAKFKAKKIVVLEYKYNIINYVNYIIQQQFLAAFILQN